MESLKIIVTGASGLLGRAVMETLSQNKAPDTLQGWAYNRTGNNKYKKINITDDDEIERAVLDYKPNVIVHLAAIRAPDIVDREYELSKKVNVTASQTLARLSAKIGAYMIYVSTDYVFDGTSPPYTEDSKPNPLNKYGQLKLEGEIAVSNTLKNNAILRVPLLYGPVEYLGEGAVDQILKCLTQDSPSKMSDYELRYPAHVNDVANVIRLLIERYVKNSTDVQGVFHWCGDEMMTKYEMAKVMAKTFNLSLDRMTPVKESDPTSSAKRPYNAQLSCQKLRNLGASNRFSFKEGCQQSYKNFVNQ